MLKMFLGKSVARFRPRGGGGQAVVGCEVTADCIRMVHVQEPDNPTAAVHTASHCLSDQKAGSDAWWAELSEAIKTLTNHHGFAGNQVILNVPTFASTEKGLKLAWMPQHERASAAVWQLAKTMEVSASELTCDTLTINEQKKGEDTNQLEVIAFAGETAVLCRLAAMMQSHGLHTMAIDSPTCAMARGVTHHHRLSGGSIGDSLVIVDVDRDEAHLSIVRHGQPRLVRHLARGEQWFHQIVAKRLNITVDQLADIRNKFATSTASSDAEHTDKQKYLDACAHGIALHGQELARELVMTVRHHMARGRDGWPAVGYIRVPAGLESLGEVMNGHSGIEFRSQFQLSAMADNNSVAVANQSEYVAAFGLALYHHTSVEKEVA